MPVNRHPEWVHQMIKEMSGKHMRKEIVEAITKKGYPITEKKVEGIQKQRGYAGDIDVERHCPICGKIFTPAYNARNGIPSKKYCSVDCQTAYRRRKDRDYKREIRELMKDEMPVTIPQRRRKGESDSSKRRALINEIARAQGKTYGQYVGEQYKVTVGRAPAGYQKVGDRQTSCKKTETAKDTTILWRE